MGRAEGAATYSSHIVTDIETVHCKSRILTAYWRGARKLFTHYRTRGEPEARRPTEGEKMKERERGGREERRRQADAQLHTGGPEAGRGR